MIIFPLLFLAVRIGPPLINYVVFHLNMQQFASFSPAVSGRSTRDHLAIYRVLRGIHLPPMFFALRLGVLLPYSSSALHRASQCGRVRALVQLRVCESVLASARVRASACVRARSCKRVRADCNCILPPDYSTLVSKPNEAARVANARRRRQV